VAKPKSTPSVNRSPFDQVIFTAKLVDSIIAIQDRRFWRKLS